MQALVHKRTTIFCVQGFGSVDGDSAQSGFFPHEQMLFTCSGAVMMTNGERYVQRGQPDETQGMIQVTLQMKQFFPMPASGPQ